MAVDKNPNNERPDNTKQVVGNTGDVVDQEPGTGKEIIRKGAGEADADVDIGTANSPLDIQNDGEFASGTRTTGGAEALAGHILDDNGDTFDVVVDWMDEDGNVLVTDNRSALTGVSDVKFNLIVRSDRFELKVQDNGGANAVHGSANAH